MSLDMTAANATLKEMFPDGKVQNLLYKERPFLATIPKDKEFYGELMKIPIIIGASQGAGTDLATAQANLYSPVAKAFLLTRKSDYVVERITREALKAGSKDIGSFLRTAAWAIESALTTAAKRIASGLYRSGTGSIGVIATGGITSGVITLATAGDVCQFEVGQTLQVAATDGGTPRAALGYVISVDRDGGTVTVASSGQGGAAASPSLWAAGDYILVQSDSNGRVSGLLAWLPTTAPSSSDSFYGVNRFSDVTRLAGCRLSLADRSISEALTKTLMRVSREQGRTTHVLTTFEAVEALQNELGAKAVYEPMKGPADIMFDAIRVNGPKGTVRVVPDADCPGGKLFALQMDTWKLYSLGGAPEIDDDSDGNQWMRIYNQDGMEVRAITYANVASNAPGWNCNTTIGA